MGRKKDYITSLRFPVCHLFIDSSKYFCIIIIIIFIGRALAKKSDFSAVLAPVEGGLDAEARTRSTEGRFQEFLQGRFLKPLCGLSSCTLVIVL